MPNMEVWMNQVELLNRKWHDEIRHERISKDMELTEAGLALGAGTMLAKTKWVNNECVGLDLDGREDRLLALLSIAFGRGVPSGFIGTLRRVSWRWAKGTKALTRFPISYAGEPQLVDREDAFLLFIADGLIACGVSPRSLMKAHGLNTAPLDSFKLTEAKVTHRPVYQTHAQLCTCIPD
jgi:hypothetical protein